MRKYLIYSLITTPLLCFVVSFTSSFALNVPSFASLIAQNKFFILVLASSSSLCYFFKWPRDASLIKIISVLNQCNACSSSSAHFLKEGEDLLLARTSSHLFLLLHTLLFVGFSTSCNGKKISHSQFVSNM